MKIGIILQARMGSIRLPGKSLKEVLGRPLLKYQVERLKRIKNAASLILATTTLPIDDILAAFAKEEKISLFRGSENNVLERFYLAAKAYDLDIIVRSTADCPLIDPAIVDQAIDTFLFANPPIDYASNTLNRTFPRGMDVEVFSFKALETCYLSTQNLSDQEHVTAYIYRHPDFFSLRNFTFPINLSSHRWTVDTPEDFSLIEKLLQTLYPHHPAFTLEDLLKLLELHPEWELLNKHIEQKTITNN